MLFSAVKIWSARPCVQDAIKLELQGTEGSGVLKGRENAFEQLSTSGLSFVSAQRTFVFWAVMGRKFELSQQAVGAGLVS